MARLVIAEMTDREMPYGVYGDYGLLAEYYTREEAEEFIKSWGIMMGE